MNKFYLLLIFLLCLNLNVGAMEKTVEGTIKFYTWFPILVGTDPYKVKESFEEPLDEEDRLARAIVSVGRIKDVASSDALGDFPKYFPLKFFYEKREGDVVSLRIGGRNFRLKIADHAGFDGTSWHAIIYYLSKISPEHPIDNF